MARFHVFAGADTTLPHPVIRRIGPADLKEALSRGIRDFLAMPSHLIFLGLIYPLVGGCLAAITFTANALPLVYPLASGFALIGPFAAIGLYEISRRLEHGEDVAWSDVFEVIRSPSIPSIAVLGLLLMGIFLLWLVTAETLYELTFGPLPPTSFLGFLEDVFTTPHGWTLLVVGNAVGFVFAVVALSVSVVSFPLLLDRDVGASVALMTSIRAVLVNPLMMAAWGVIVTVGLVLGSIPLFVGLAVVMPVFGHATWHLYRRVVEHDGPDTNPIR